MKPEKIWADYESDLGGTCVADEVFHHWYGADSENCTEYIRGDIVGELEARVNVLSLENASLKFELARLNKALEQAKDKAGLIHREDAEDMSQEYYDLHHPVVVFHSLTPELAAWLKEHK